MGHKYISEIVYAFYSSVSGSGTRPPYPSYDARPSKAYYHDWVYHMASRALLTRLLLLKLFLTSSKSTGIEDDADHKRLWLCFQLKEDLVSPELRDSISKLRKKIDDWYVDDNAIRDAIRETLQELFSPADPLLSESLYIALDQANAGRLVHLIDRKYPLFSSSDDDKDGMPMLKVILRIWRSHTQDFDVTYVVAGTQVDSKAFSTDDPEWSSWRWCSNTGNFASDIVRHRAYVEGYFPPKILQEPWGRLCVERVLRWCRGR